MATRGFEFAYALDGGSGTPVIRDFTLGDSTAYKVGDLVVMKSDGYVDKATTGLGEVTGVMQEAVTSPTAGTTKAKVAIAMREHVWRCSMDATSAATAIVGYTKRLDTVDANTIDADDVTTGSLILVDKSQLDDEGNVLAYVVFADTTFGNT